MTSSTSTNYLIDREELLRIRQVKLLTNDRDYVFFALQIDYPGKLNPTIEVSVFCERWNLDDEDFYKVLGELREKGIVVSIAKSFCSHCAIACIHPDTDSSCAIANLHRLEKLFEKNAERILASVRKRL